MPNSLIEIQVDIYNFPRDIQIPKTYAQITIGDLHGNAMKLLFMLIREGIATNISETDYLIISRIYQQFYDIKKLTPEKMGEDIDKFNRLIDGMRFNNKSQIRLIGDELADRGSNDYFMLKILQKLHEAQVPVEIMISNHGIDFLVACENYPIIKCFSSLIGRHAVSLSNLQILIDHRIIHAEGLLKIVDIIYKPTLKVLSYSLSHDNSEITIFSHAIIDFHLVRNLAHQFEVNYADSSIQDLTRTIDQINQKFQDYVASGRVHTLYKVEEIKKGDYTKTPFVFVIWNRNPELTIANPYQTTTILSNHNTRTSLKFVHGHQPIPLTTKHVYNLNNNNCLGNSKDSSVGVYVFLRTYGRTIITYLARIQYANLNQNLSSSRVTDKISDRSGFSPLQKEQARDLLLRRARNGDEVACYHVGLMYYNGRDVAQDYNQAVSWFRLAAESGYGVAQHILGTCYRRGVGVRKDHGQAFSWLHKSAINGCDLAQYLVARYYKSGLGVEQNSIQAFYWFRRAAEQGHVDAQYFLALCYNKGEGVLRNNARAIGWFFSAGAQNHANAKKDCITLINHIITNFEIMTNDDITWFIPFCSMAIQELEQYGSTPNEYHQSIYTFFVKIKHHAWPSIYTGLGIQQNSDQKNDQDSRATIKTSIN